MTDTKNGMARIAFVQDSKLSRERNLALVQGLASLRTFVEIDVLKPETTEKELVARLGASGSEPYLLYVVPWHKAGSMLQLESALGASRLDGPLVVAYAGEPLRQTVFSPSGVRPILVNFADHALGNEFAAKILKHLATPSLRVGPGDWLDAKARLYNEVWRTPDLARSLARWLAIPEWNTPEWTPSLAAVRAVLLSVWSLVWEVGPGRTTSARASAQKGEPLAQLIVGVDTRYAVIQILMKAGKWHPGDLVRLFWNPHHLSPSGVLQNYAPLVRVHAVATQPWVEITAVLSNVGSPSPDPASVWIETVSETLLVSQTEATEKRLIPMPDPTRLETGPDFEQLRQQLAEQSALVEEMRSGGVGHQVATVQNTEDLLELFQERYFDAKLALHTLRAELSSLEGQTPKGQSQGRVEEISHNIDALENRLRRWLGQLGGTIEKIKKERIG